MPMVGPDIGGVEGLWSYLAGDKRVAMITLVQLAAIGRECATRIMARQG